MTLPGWQRAAALGWILAMSLGSPSLHAQKGSAPVSSSAIEGYWLGPLRAGGQSLRIQITVKRDDADKLSCMLDSLDQGAGGIPCANVTLTGQDFAFEVKPVNGRYAGKLAADGKSIAGTWSQGSPLPLNFAKQDQAQALPPRPTPTFDPALPPVDATTLKAVLDRDLDKALTSGSLAPQTGAGITIGIVTKGKRSVFSYGTAKNDSIYEIGSITKTFTGLLLAQMVQQGKVKLEEPVRELLPAGTVAKPAGREITLLDLVTQHSGLPRMPTNFNPADVTNPYVDYRAANLYEFVKQHGVARPEDATFVYSNLGVGLLGQALSNRAGMSYEKLLEEQITGPLGLKDTVLTLSPAQQARFIQGHTADNEPAHSWELDALAGAGGIRSTAGDMLTYLEAQLHPEKLSGSSLASTIPVTHELRGDAGPGARIGFAWIYQEGIRAYWHNGGTGGYSSYAMFNAKEDRAFVVLVNRTMGARGSLADLLGAHIGQRLVGEPAVSLR